MYTIFGLLYTQTGNDALQSMGFTMEDMPNAGISVAHLADSAEGRDLNLSVNKDEWDENEEEFLDQSKRLPDEFYDLELSPEEYKKREQQEMARKKKEHAQWRKDNQ